jgi:hypothetical protein
MHLNNSITGYRNFIGATMTTPTIYTSSCPKCKTGAISNNAYDKEFLCVNCGWRCGYDRTMPVNRTICDGSGLSVIAGTEREGRVKSGRCPSCGRIVQMLVGRNLTISHAPRPGAGDRVPMRRNKSYGLRGR